MARLPLLPAWILPPTLPSIYESESATALEMVAKVYGATKTVVEDYNKFTDEINKEISNFTSSSTEEIENFKKYVERRLSCQFQAMEQQMAAIKVEIQKDTIAHVNNVMAESIRDVAVSVINDAIAAGTLAVAVNYDPDTEEVTVVTGGEV